jgi:hypothetical protein
MPWAFRQLLYQHDDVSTTPWPTLGELIESNKRILFFHYNGERCDTTAATCPNGLMNWFDYAAESEYSFATIEALQDHETACRVTRGDTTSSLSSSNHVLYGVNVFTNVPSPENCAAVNAAAFLRSHLTNCATIARRSMVNVLLVDCWNVGDVLSVVYEYNTNRTLPL